MLLCLLKVKVRVALVLKNIDECFLARRSEGMKHELTRLLQVSVGGGYRMSQHIIKLLFVNISTASKIKEKDLISIILSTQDRLNRKDLHE